VRPLITVIGKKCLLACILSVTCLPHCFSWGFFAHRKINYYSVFLLPPELVRFYKPQIDFISEHAVDPDKRRYILPEEGPRHFMDMDKYGRFPYDSIPHKWEDAVKRFTENTLKKYGIVPWWIDVMQKRLTAAFKEKDVRKILKLSAEIGHYIADAHVPLHANSNHNGQFTDQKGIHAFWESRIPELLADNGWDFFIGKAEYIPNPSAYIWKRIGESGAAADTVLQLEKELSRSFPSSQKFSFEERNGLIIRQYSSAFSKAYDEKLKGMIQRRMRLSIYSIASFWYTAWVNAGQPPLSPLDTNLFTEQDQAEFEKLNQAWRTGKMQGREED
jgi:hypothetical protein